MTKARITRTWVEIEYSGDDLRETLVVETDVPLSDPEAVDQEDEWHAVIKEAKRLYDDAKGALSLVRIIPTGVR